MAKIRKKYADLALTGKNPTNAESVLAGIRNILHTRIGERMFDRKFGSNIEDYLFEPYTFITSRLILSELLSSITRNDTRVKILAKDTSVIMNPDKRQYEVVIALEIIGLEGVFKYEESLIPQA